MPLWRENCVSVTEGIRPDDRITKELSRVQLTGRVVLREALKIFEDVGHARIQVLHPAVDVVLVLLNEVQDSSVMDDRVVQTRDARPQTCHVSIQS